MRPFVFIFLLACRSKDSAPVETGALETTETTPDVDADGCNADEDCDDNNSVVNPAASESCDGVDNDCTGTADDDTELLG